MGDGETTVTALEVFLGTIGDVFEQMISWIGDVCTMILSEPLLIFPIAIGVIALVLGVVRRFVMRAGI